MRKWDIKISNINTSLNLWWIEEEFHIYELIKRKEDILWEIRKYIDKWYHLLSIDEMKELARLKMSLYRIKQRINKLQTEDRIVDTNRNIKKANKEEISKSLVEINWNMNEEEFSDFFSWLVNNIINNQMEVYHIKQVFSLNSSLSRYYNYIKLYGNNIVIKESLDILNNYIESVILDKCITGKMGTKVWELLLKQHHWYNEEDKNINKQVINVNILNQHSTEELIDFIENKKVLDMKLLNNKQ